jgi:hypothetical protein
MLTGERRGTIRSKQRRSSGKHGHGESPWSTMAWSEGGEPGRDRWRRGCLLALRLSYGWWDGRGKTRPAGIDEFLAGVGGGIGDFPVDWESPGSIPCTRMIREKRRFSWCSQNEEGRPEVAAPWRGGGGGASSFAYRETKKEGGGERREWRRPEGRGLGFSWLGWRLKGEGSGWRYGGGG